MKFVYFSYLLLFIFISIIIFSCKLNWGKKNTVSTPANAYLNEVFTLIEDKSVNRDLIDWVDLKNRSFHMADSCQTVVDCYPVVKFIIAELKDNHSYFSPNIKAENTLEKELPQNFPDEEVPGDIGYVRIPFFIGDEQIKNQFIQKITQTIVSQNHAGLKGWILDLRNNFGGNMWPMIAAAGSLLEDGPLGYFLGNDGQFEQWSLIKGNVYLDSVILEKCNFTDRIYGKSKLAVLINEQTASSGEAMAVIFKGYNQARFFGKPTYGVSTGCESFTLSDSSRINLATSIFVDRNKREYGKKIEPDVICDENNMVDKAIEWIYQ